MNATLPNPLVLSEVEAPPFLSEWLDDALSEEMIRRFVGGSADAAPPPAAFVQVRTFDSLDSQC